MTFDLEGKLTEKYDTKEISDRFRKREFVLEAQENNPTFDRVNYVKFQLTQDKCELLDQYNVGDNLKVSFNIRGNRWEKNGNVSYFTNLEAWRMEKSGGSSEPAQPAAPPADIADESDSDELPF
jgi:hypothetical protein